MKAPTEAGFRAQVIKRARQLGWSAYSVPDSRRCTSPGFPDCVFGRSDGAIRLIVAELKRVGERPTAEQGAWLSVFAASGVPAHVWTPADWPKIEAALAAAG